MDELIRYVELDDSDRARLTALHAKLAPMFPDIAARFYEAVWANPSAGAVLSGPEQVERLRVTLIDWMSTGLLGPYDEAFVEKRSRIGRRHVIIGLKQQYMFTAMDVLRNAYLDRIAKLYPADEALLVVRSVNKLFDIELALMLRHYQLHSEERLLARERAIMTERIAALQTMSAGLAHEVRNPLNAAKLQLELLERRLRRQGDDPALVEPTQLAHQEIGRLTELLNDFLAFVRTSDLHARDHDVVAIAKQVIDLERAVAERTGAAIELVAPEGALIARIDAGKVHQILQNLVRNALEAAPKGHVTLGVDGNAKMLLLRVGDDGPGIPDDVRARIFEPFFSTKDRGTGMGMAIVHNFVVMHGGTIDIHTSSHGTQVEIALPRAA